MMIKRHTRPNPAKQIKGGIAERESPIPVSNVMVVCPSCNKAVRIAHHVDHAGRRQNPARRASAASAARRSTRSKAEDSMAARLKEHYQKTVVPALTKEFGYKNVMAVPKIEKIAVNIGLGEATQNAKLMDGAVNETGADRGPEAGDHQGHASRSRHSSCARAWRSAAW